MEKLRDSKEYIKSFAERTNLPARASQSALERIGARYLVTMPFKLNGIETKIEYMALEKENKLYFWKKTSHQEEFSIHGEFHGTKY